MPYAVASASHLQEIRMERRRFLTSSLAASAVAMASQTVAQSSPAKPREFYELRRYHLQSGPQTKLVETYFAEALIPALNRLGLAPIGAFHLDIGPETPAFYLLIPTTALDTLATAEHRLLQDDQFTKAAEPFWSAPATAPAYIRVDSSLLIAFEGWPKLTPPPKGEHPEKRVLQMRTYESPSNRDHVLKVAMFMDGEFDCFQRAGFSQVFYGDALIGPRLPHLTYMLSYPDLSELNAKWDAFRSDPAWKKLSTNPKYAFESIVSNITNLILGPTSYSQI
jgi:NIPSNAP